jgi:DNA topoisomerase VI subunit A
MFNFMFLNGLVELAGGKLIILGCHGSPTFTVRSALSQLAVGKQVFLLFDGNVYGLEMALNLIFGSRSNSWLDNQPTVPGATWIGLKMSEVPAGAEGFLDSDDVELNRLRLMALRPYLPDVFLHEIQHMLLTKKKMQLESICEPILDFFNFLLGRMGLPLATQTGNFTISLNCFSK